MRNFSISCGMMLVFLVAAVSVEIAPSTAGPVAVITNPWSGHPAYDVVAAADGRILRLGPWRWVAIADDMQSADFHSRLKAAGAWLVLAPIGLGTCVAELSNPNDSP